MVDLSGLATTLAVAAGGAVLGAAVLNSDAARGAVNEATAGPNVEHSVQAPEPVLRQGGAGGPVTPTRDAVRETVERAEETGGTILVERTSPIDNSGPAIRIENIGGPAPAGSSI